MSGQLIRKYAGYFLILFIVGFAIGQRIGSFVLTPSPTVYFKETLRGVAYIDSLPTSDGECAYDPADNTFLNDAIVTDSKTRGYVLGSIEFWDSELEPGQDGMCSYGGDFDVSISPNGIYELAFPSIYSPTDDIPVFEALPELSPYIDPADAKEVSQLRPVSQTWVRWLLTTVSCPNDQPICVRADLR